MNNKNSDFLENLKRIDPEGFVYNPPSDLKKIINPKRLNRIIKSNGKDAKVDEIQKLLDYYTEKAGRDIGFDDLFGE